MKTLENPPREISKIVARHKTSPKHSSQYSRTGNYDGFIVPKLSVLGCCLSVLLVYLVLVAQFASFLDPFLIVLAVPTGLVGVMLTLAFTRYDSEHSVAYGNRDAHGNGRFQQHLDRRLRQPACVRKGGAFEMPSLIPAASACVPS